MYVPATFAVEAYLTEAFTSKPFATLSTYAFVAASWSLDGSVTFVILLELTSTVPEPLGSSIKSMFVSSPADPILTPLPVAEFVTSIALTAFAVCWNIICSLPAASVIAPSSAILGVVNVGLVNVLFVKVCDPVSVATVLSIATVNVLPEPDVSIPVPPAIVSVSESKSMFNAPPESPWKSRSCAVTCESTYALIDCWVASAVALLLDISSSSAIAVIPSNKFNSVDVAVKATSSFNLGDVKVLFVSVCVPANVATVLSIAKVISLSETVVSIPVPPVNVKVWPVVNVSFEPLSAASVKLLEAGAANDRLPEPSVVNKWPLEPSALGKVNVTELPTLLGALSAMKCAPLLVPSLNLIVPPVVALLPTSNSSIALFESTIRPDEAVNVPCAWSINWV